MANPAPTKKAAPKKAEAPELLKDEVDGFEDTPVSKALDMDEAVEVIACKEGYHGKRRHIGETFSVPRRNLHDTKLPDGRTSKASTWYFEVGTPAAVKAMEEAENLAN